MDRYALITGASRGLGANLAARFKSVGYNLCLIGRDAERLERMANSLPYNSSKRVVCLAKHLEEPSACSELFEEVKQIFPHLDVLINNAAIHGPIGPFEENDCFKWARTIQINLLAPVLLCQAFLPLIKKSKTGSIINVSGGGATGPRPNFTAYGTSKAALVRFSETLAKELKSRNIRVNCIAPGAMPTDLLAEVFESAAGEKEVEAAQKVFHDDASRMDKVSDLALFLASERSQHITGKLISAQWDDWEAWPEHIDQLNDSDVYTLRRITGRDRGHTWGDK
jgi:NAD(P)-dependent dehydrogenase (short-subunit alcohol dehydrogenase family)